TRSSTCASPRAAFSCSFSSSSARSRGLTPGLPPSPRPALPPSRNCRFQVEIDCSDAFPRRAASATLISPLMTARTSRHLSSIEKTEGRATYSSPHGGQDEHTCTPRARILSVPASSSRPADDPRVAALRRLSFQQRLAYRARRRSSANQAVACLSPEGLAFVHAKSGSEP